MMENSMPILNL